MNSLTTMPPRFPTSRPACRARMVLRLHPNGDDGELAGQLGPVGELDAGQLALVAEEGGHAVIGDHVRALGSHVVFHQVGQLRVEEGQHLGHVLDHGDLDARQMQGFARLDADQSAADDDGPVAGLFIADGAQLVGIFQGLQGGDALQVTPGTAGHLGMAPVASTSLS